MDGAALVLKLQQETEKPFILEEMLKIIFRPCKVADNKPP